MTTRDLTLAPPVRPFVGLRGLDGFGGGGYDAPRMDASGQHYGHRGLDFRADVGAAIVAPCPCIVQAIGIAYLGSDLASLHLDGIGEFADLSLKLLYVKPHPDVITSAVFATGDPLGIAQAVAGYWQARHPERGLMQNHLHLELRIHEASGERLVDPTGYFSFREVV